MAHLLYPSPPSLLLPLTLTPYSFSYPFSPIPNPIPYLYSFLYITPNPYPTVLPLLLTPSPYLYLLIPISSFYSAPDPFIQPPPTPLPHPSHAAGFPRGIFCCINDNSGLSPLYDRNITSNKSKWGNICYSFWTLFCVMLMHENFFFCYESLLLFRLEVKDLFFSPDNGRK